MTFEPPPRGRYLLASDASAVIERTRRVTYLNDGEMVVITRDAGYEIKTLDNVKLIREVRTKRARAAQSARLIA